MNIKLYQATMAQLRSRALASLASIERLLDDKAAQSPQIDVTEHIVKHALELVQHEGAMHSLQQYFERPPAARPPPPSAPPSTGEPLTVTPEMSSTYKQSLEEQKLKADIAKRRKEKKDE